MADKKSLCTSSNKTSIVVGLILACLAGGTHLLGQSFIKNRMHQVKFPSRSLVILHLKIKFEQLKIEKNAVISNDSDSFQSWISPPAKVYKKYFIFHVENAAEVQSGEQKPKLVQKGPYTYRQASA